MMRASMAALQMAAPTVRRRGVAGVHAVVHLEDVTLPDGATEAYVPVTLSHPVSGTDLVLTLSGGVLCTIPVGQTSGKSAHYTVTPGDPPFEVTIASYEGGSFASLDVSGTCTVTPGQPLEAERVYVGSSVHATSGALDKADLLALIDDADEADVEVDCEVVGGGASGRASPNNNLGGTPGKVAKLSVPYVDLPETIEFIVGAGGIGTSLNTINEGGASEIVGIVSVPSSGIDGYANKDRPTGPGQGALSNSSSPGWDGGASNNSIPELRLAGGVGSSSSSANRNGLDATTPFQHGSGGGAGAVSYSGNGGWPGGGGACGKSYTAGSGGAGAVRFHVYKWVRPQQPLERVYKGSIVQATSGSISKTDLLSIAGDVAISSVEVDCEAVGGGGGGWSGSGNVGKGGAPGKVAVATVPYALLPDVIDFMVAAGGTHSSAGGSTDIVGIVTAAVSGSNATFVSPKDRPTGPGAGAAVYLGDGEAKRGGASNDSIPELRMAGGTGAVGRPSSNGKDATTPFQHGSAGGSHVQHGGYGGWPGGGGGHGGGSGYFGGKGGAGAARFHVYVWE